MRSEVESKRNKFAKDIRMRQHEQYFQMHRQSSAAQLPALAYLPIMLQNELYEDIEAIIDTIQTTCQPEQMSQPMLKTIRQRYQHHSDTNIRVLMLKLLNRLLQWNPQDVNSAILLIKQGRQEIVKQLALYLQSNLNRLQKKQKQHNQQQKSFNKEIMDIFNIILPMKIIDVENRIFWLDIVCKTIEIVPTAIYQCIHNIDAFMFAIDVGINNSNQFQLVRVFKIITQLTTIKQCQFRIIQLNCFPTFLNMIVNGSIEVVVEGLEILAELMSIEDVIVYKLVHQFGVMKILNKYIDHIMVAVQTRVLWALSNVAGSQNYSCILQDQTILNNLFKKSKLETRPQIRIQSFCCLLNIFCNCTPVELELLQNNYNITELIMSAIRQFHNPNIKSLLFQRLLYSIFHMVHDYAMSSIKFEQLGLKKNLEEIYEEEKDEGKLKMLDEVLNLISKKSGP